MEGSEMRAAEAWLDGTAVERSSSAERRVRDAQYRYLCEVSAALRDVDDGLVHRTGLLHLETTRQVFETQLAVLALMGQAETEVHQIRSGSAAVSLERPSEERLEDVFPDLVEREHAARRRLHDLAAEMPADHETLAVLTQLLADEREFRSSGDSEMAATARWTDEMWCAARSLHRAVVDDAHARVLLQRHATSLRTSAERTDTVVDAARFDELDAIVDRVGTASPQELRGVLIDLVQALPTPVAVIPGDVRPVDDTPVIHLDGAGDRPEFWAAAPQRWRDRLRLRRPRPSLVSFEVAT